MWDGRGRTVRTGACHSTEEVDSKIIGIIFKQALGAGHINVSDRVYLYNTKDWGNNEPVRVFTREQYESIMGPIPKVVPAPIGKIKVPPFTSVTTPAFKKATERPTKVAPKRPRVTPGSYFDCEATRVARLGNLGHLSVPELMAAGILTTQSDKAGLQNIGDV